MKRSLLVLSTAAALALPGSLAAQGVGIGARAGTLGLGAEAALGLTDAFVIRGGIGLMPLEPSATFNNIDFTVNLPSTMSTIGVDLYLGGSFRIGGGILFKPDDPTLDAEIRADKSVDIGGQTYTSSQVSKLTGTVDSKDKAPYVLIGFGKHTSTGFGLFLDLGVAFIGDPTIHLKATGDPAVIGSADFKSRLDQEARNVQDDIGSYLKVWPILNLGLRLGVG